MGSSERRRRHKRELRQRILDTARELIVEHGLEAVTIRRIAEAIEYSPTALYLHFRDKDALIEELCAQDFRSLAHRLSAIATVEDPLERLQQIGRAYVQFAVEHPGQYRFMFMVVRDHQHGEESMAHKGDPREDGYALTVATVRDAIAAGQIAPELHDADLVAQLFWGALHGPIALQLINSNSDFVTWRPLVETCDRLIDILLRGVQNRQAAPTAVVRRE